MKRILLTTTSLVLAAGFASADVSFSGTAGIALIDDNGASVATHTSSTVATANAAKTAAATFAVSDHDAAVLADGVAATAAQTATRVTLVAASVAAAAVEAAQGAADVNTANTAARAGRDGMFFESYYDLDITATAETDNGITVKLGFDMGSGGKIDYDDDDKLEMQGATIGDADVAVSYNGWTLAVDQAGIDNLFDDTDGSQDVSLSGSVAGWTVALTSDQEGSTSSYKVGGTIGGIALTVTGTDKDDNNGDASKVAISYAMGALTLSASAEDESKADGSEDDQTVGVKYAMNDALTLSYTSIKPGNKSFGDEWDAKVAYSAGGVKTSFATDETDATTVIAEYSLGGGATAFAAMHDKAGTASDLTAQIGRAHV